MERPGPGGSILSSGMAERFPDTADPAGLKAPREAIFSKIPLAKIIPPIETGIC
jgi:hypothetical protein